MTRSPRPAPNPLDSLSSASLLFEEPAASPLPLSPEGEADSLDDLDQPRQRDVSLLAEAEKRYLTYALSVISSRALPDVRDGLKPVQRRILWAMFHNLRLLPSAKYRKSAAVVGETMGKFHPHGDQSIYDAMVRMAQPFSLRAPLVDGYGNFGSVDGDKAAAMRYTEARLQSISLELLDELRYQTTSFRPNFDGTLEEPVVLPARFPNLLVNGVSGIAVGMATSIPPHHLGEVIDGLLLLLDTPEAPTEQLVKKIKGPDFPTGGELITPRKERIKIYEEGQGAFTVRGEWKEEPSEDPKKILRVVITSIPYAVTRATLVEKIAEEILEKRLPPLLDIRDESTEKTRIVLEMKPGSDIRLVMAYLCKETSLQQKFQVNLTCLIPTANPLISTPSRLSLKQILEQFLAFRFECLEKRFRFELAEIQRKIHLLKGFQAIFSKLDLTLQMIRQADGRKDALRLLKEGFSLDEEQADAILETRIYRLSRLEITSILEELKLLSEKALDIEAILQSRVLLQEVLRKECEDLRKAYADKRQTKIAENETSLAVDADAFIQDEDTKVILTRDGWIKRSRSIADPKAIRTREGDSVFAILPGSTREAVVFFTDQGSAFTQRIHEIPATSGYGVPLQSLFKFADNEKVIGALSFDPRICGDIYPPAESPVSPRSPSAPASPASLDTAKPRTKAKSKASESATLSFLPSDSLSAKGRPSGSQAALSISEDGGEAVTDPSLPIPPIHLFVATQQGLGLRLSLLPFLEPSSKAGRRYIRLAKDDLVLAIRAARDTDTAVLATTGFRSLLFPLREVSFLAGPGKGVKLIQLDDGDSLLACEVAPTESDGLRLQTDKEETIILSPATEEIGRRASKGTKKRGLRSWQILPPLLLAAAPSTSSASDEGLPSPQTSLASLEADVSDEILS